MMDCLMAILAGLGATLPGPLRFPAVFFTHLRTKQSLGRIEQMLRDLLLANKQIHGPLRAVLRDFDEDSDPFMQELGRAVMAIIGLHENQQLRVRTLHDLKGLAQSAFGEDHLPTLKASRLVTVGTLEDECVETYGDDIKEFRRVVRRGGFDLADLSDGDSNKVTISECLNILMTKRYRDEQRTSVMEKLAAGAQGSDILWLAARLLKAKEKRPGNTPAAPPATPAARKCPPPSQKKLSHVRRIVDVLRRRPSPDKPCSPPPVQACQLGEDSFGLCREVGMGDIQIARSLALFRALEQVKRSARAVGKMQNISDTLDSFDLDVGTALGMARYVESVPLPLREKMRETLALIEALRAECQQTSFYNRGSADDQNMAEDRRICGDIGRSALALDRVLKSMLSVLEEDREESGRQIGTELARLPAPA